MNRLMGRKEIYEARMQELGWTLYRLAQEIICIRKERGEEPPTIQGLESSLRKALKEPEPKSQQTNDDIVKALGGESIIRWISHQDVKL
ncbi:hypothetical protein NDI45_27640 [Leptolyngbya sp. GB1-A1]|uniref:hypothetical protein n=1 Tax=Leptolyngbya sp. GB1-A1 TaxID=2933908 RepID=UPI003297428B